MNRPLEAGLTSDLRPDSQLESVGCSVNSPSLWKCRKLAALTSFGCSRGHMLRQVCLPAFLCPQPSTRKLHSARESAVVPAVRRDGCPTSGPSLPKKAAAAVLLHSSLPEARCSAQLSPVARSGSLARSHPGCSRLCIG